MQLEDWSECPSCHFPCRLTAFKQVIQSQQQCVLCNQAVSVDDVKLVQTPTKRVSSLQGVD